MSVFVFVRMKREKTAKKQKNGHDVCALHTRTQDGLADRFLISRMYERGTGEKG